MPIYEYCCQSCGVELEKLQKISDPPLRECPECGKETLVKLVSASSFRLKGSGWYETDFKNKKKAAGDSATESGKSDDKAGTEKAAEKSTEKSAEKKDSAASGSGSKTAA